jgi:hypothetical protein
LATAPAFAATPNNGSAQLGATADTSYTAPAQTVTLFTAGASGSQVNEIDMVGTGTTVAGVVNVFRKNGSNYFMLDSFIVTVVTPSTTVSAFRASHTYSNLILKSGDSIVASSWAANQLICASAYGGDF